MLLLSDADSGSVLNCMTLVTRSILTFGAQPPMSTYCTLVTLIAHQYANNDPIDT